MQTYISNPIEHFGCWQVLRLKKKFRMFFRWWLDYWKYKISFGFRILGIEFTYDVISSNRNKQ